MTSIKPAQAGERAQVGAHGDAEPGDLGRPTDDQTDDHPVPLNQAAPPIRTPESWPASTAWRGVIILALVLFVAGAIAGAWSYQLSNSTDQGIAPTAFLACALLLIGGVSVPLITAWERRLYNEEEDKCNRDCQELGNALDNIDDATLSGLAKANFKQMRMFTTVAVRQARVAFYASVAAAWASLLVLLAGATVATSVPETGARIVAGALTAIGAVLSAFLTNVFIRSYSMAASQMSYYYGQPLVHCYLLHAEWLARSATNLEPRQRWHLLKQIVNASIHASQSAQQHLLQLQVDTRRAPRRVKRSAADTNTSHTATNTDTTTAPIP